jgi:cell division septation protein DedD
MKIIMKKACVFPLFFALFTVFPAIITFAQDLQEGNATWYSDDTLDLYASHARLPPGTMLRVTNLNNEREVYVTVMGRIQNSDNRILDISQAAAELLEMNERGYTPIRLVVIRGLMPEPTPASSRTADNSSVRDDAPIPEITAVSVFPDDEGYEDNYYGYDDYYGYDNYYGYDDYNGYDSYSGYDDYSGYSSYPDETPAQATYAETPSSPPPPVRTFPQQSVPQAQPAQTAQQSVPQAQPGQAAQPATGQVMLKKIVVLINGKEQIIDVPDGVYIPYPTGQTPSATVIQPYTPPAPSQVYIQPAPLPQPARAAAIQPLAGPGIKIIPSLPDPNSGKVYRIQVGAFSQPALAQVCFEKLRASGLSPAYEQNGSLYRVVLSGIRAADVSYTAQRLSASGFTEAWIREESRY